jgi:hypothetical protein
MKNLLLKRIKNKRNIAVIGLSKNAGKTTFVNWLARSLENFKIAMITTGRDGEEQDLVEGHRKPKVYIPKNTIYSTLESEVIKQSQYLKVLEKLNYSAVGKNLWLVEALKDLQGETVGPASVMDQTKLIEIVSKYKIDKCIIDGALDRKSISLSPEVDSCILVVSPSFGSKQEVLFEMERVKLMHTIPSTNKDFENSDYIYADLKDKKFPFKMIYGNESVISDFLGKNECENLVFPGALTKQSFEKIIPLIEKYNTKWIFRHPVQFHLKVSQLKRLILSNKIFVNHQFLLDGIIVNSYSHQNKHFDCAEVKNIIQGMFKNIPVFDIMQLDIL